MKRQPAAREGLANEATKGRKQATTATEEATSTAEVVSGPLEEEERVTQVLRGVRRPLQRRRNQRKVEAATKKQLDIDSPSFRDL